MVTPPAPRPAPGARGAYRHFVPHTTRWADNDLFGHLNNVVYYSLFDTALSQHFAAKGVGQDPHAGHLLVIAESGCRYHAEVRFPDPVVIGMRLAGLGRSSLRFELALFRGDDEAASAEGFMVHVCVDAATRRPAPMPEAWRLALQEEAAWTPG